MNIYPEDHVDENFFDIYYHPFKKQIWGAGFLIVAVTVGYLGMRQFQMNRLEDEWSRYYEAKAIQVPLGDTPEVDATVSDKIATLQQIASEYPDDQVAPWALKGVIDAQVAAKEYDAALVSLDELEKRFPDFALNSLPASPTAREQSLAASLRADLLSEQEWTAETAYEHRWPAGDRTACIETNDGTFWIGFYAEDAPAHVEAFVSRAKAGKYNGTLVYQVREAADGSPQLFRAGSAASKTERDPAKHDRDEPLDTIEPEDTRYTIHHVKRIVSSVEMPSGESATRFQVILANEMTRYNGQTTPFAAVLDQEKSFDAVEKIGRAETYGTNPETASADDTYRMRDSPYPAIYIRRVTILRNEKIEDGHVWDTSRAFSNEPEPWEADRKPDPKPEEFTVSTKKTSAPGAGDNPGEAGDEDSGSEKETEAGSDETGADEPDTKEDDAKTEPEDAKKADDSDSTEE